MIENAGAVRVFPPIVTISEMIPVVVMSNGMFEAAGIAFDVEELKAFSLSRDPRPKVFLLVPREMVIWLCPSVERYLKW